MRWCISKDFKITRNTNENTVLSHTSFLSLILQNSEGCASAVKRILGKVPGKLTSDVICYMYEECHSLNLYIYE